MGKTISMQGRVKTICFITVICLVSATPHRAQNAEDYNNGLSINVDPTEDHFLRFALWSPIWAHATEDNPNTPLKGDPQHSSYNLGEQRGCVLDMAQASGCIGPRDTVRLQPFSTYSRENLGAFAIGSNDWYYNANLFMPQYNAPKNYQHSLRPNYIAINRMDGQRRELIA